MSFDPSRREYNCHTCQRTVAKSLLYDMLMEETSSRPRPCQVHGEAIMVVQHNPLGTTLDWRPDMFYACSTIPANPAEPPTVLQCTGGGRYAPTLIDSSPETVHIVDSIADEPQWTPQQVLGSDEWAGSSAQVLTDSFDRRVMDGTTVYDVMDQIAEIVEQHRNDEDKDDEDKDDEDDDDGVFNAIAAIVDAHANENPTRAPG